MQTASAIRVKLRPDTIDFLTEIWEQFLMMKEWPPSRVIHSKYGKANVVAAWNQLSGSVVFETDNLNNRRYQLTLIGILLTAKGEDYEQLLANYLAYTHRLYLEEPEKIHISKSETVDALGLSTEQSRLLPILLQTGSLFSGSCSISEDSWTFGLLTDVEDFPQQTDFRDELNKLIFRHYDPSAPVGHEERLASFQQADYHSIHHSPPAMSVQSAGQSNPLKKRYQVFVSSTYEDLREERHHAILALLETKCIPTGMELFPAASTSQWELIKRVIDECDYYILIIAGRYGTSVPNSEISYTEREFDYALSLGKPIISFCHENIDNLTGNKLEKSDAGKLRLQRFRKKAENRLCRFWKDSGSLSSSIKSAVFNAIEHDPQPGWIRATSFLFEQDTILKLQQRIAELERSTGKKGESTTSEVTDNLSEAIDIPITGYFCLYDNDHRYLSYKDRTKHFEKTIKKSLNSVFHLWVPKLEKVASTASLKRTLESDIAKTLQPEGIVSENHACEANCTVDGKLFEEILRTLQHEGLIVPKQSPKKMRSKRPHWAITPAGSKHYAKSKSLLA